MLFEFCLTHTEIEFCGFWHCNEIVRYVCQLSPADCMSWIILFIGVFQRFWFCEKNSQKLWSNPIATHFAVSWVSSWAYQLNWAYAKIKIKNKTLIAYSRFGWKWNIRSIINCLIEFISQQMIVGRIQYKQLHIANAIIWCCVGKWKVIGLSFTMNCMIVVLNEEIGDFNHNWYWEEGVVAAAIHSILYKFVLAWRTFFENCTESIQKPCFVWAKAIVSYILSAAVFDETIRMGLSMISKMNVCWITSTDYSIMWQEDITYYIYTHS